LPWREALQCPIRVSGLWSLGMPFSNTATRVAESPHRGEIDSLFM
jgi:hypothetical protein